MDDPRPGDPSPDDPHHYPDDPYGGHGQPAELQHTVTPEVVEPAPLAPASGGTRTPPPTAPPPDDPDEDDGMLRMSFLEHLEELRSRIIRCLWGIGIAFVTAMSFSSYLWNFIRRPATDALTQIGVKPPVLITTDPTEGISIIWIKLPLVVSLFLAAPWVIYQVWSFISPGLYKRERKWAAPFILTSAGLFVGGGLFAYFVAFRFGLPFLLSVGVGEGVVPMPTVSLYFDLFVNVTLGVAIIFELPVLMFLLTLLHIVSPGFLIRHSRYAILAIVILAAVITPTADVVNLSIFAIPMILLYFLGVFASFLLVLKREGRNFPWKAFGLWFGSVLLALLACGWIAVRYYHYHFIAHWPFITK